MFSNNAKPNHAKILISMTSLEKSCVCEDNACEADVLRTSSLVAFRINKPIALHASNHSTPQVITEMIVIVLIAKTRHRFFCFAKTSAMSNQAIATKILYRRLLDSLVVKLYMRGCTRYV